MFFLHIATVLGAVGSAYGQIFVPDEVREFAALAREEFSSYFHFTGSPSDAGGSHNATARSESLHIDAASCSYWMEDIAHQGYAAFNPNPSGYQVFRNVQDFGAKGDGVTDDTAAINSAISSGGRCAPGSSCSSSTVTPAVVYFPAGTYVVSSSIVDYYYTQLIGNPNCLPTIKASASFANAAGTIGIIDGDPYNDSGNLGFGATNVFWRQIRNFIIDTTAVSASSDVSGVHWPTGQATSIQNVIFQLAPGSQHVGIFIENGSGGFINDLIFNGGAIGLNVGNQQFTMRNITFNGVSTAINQIWDWGWTYQNLNINNCGVGLKLSSGAPSSLSVGSIVMLDSTISNTPVGIITGKSSSSQPQEANSLVLENIQLNNVGTALQGPDGDIIGNVGHISAYASGNSYTPNGPNPVSGSISANSRPSSLVQSTGNYYQRSKPQYEGLPTSSFLSARSAGATGNGRTDDTSALQNAINNAKSSNRVLYLDQGDYLVTSTIYVPAGSRIVGESYSVILSSGGFFNDMNNPQPVVQIGKPGETGTIEWSDSIVSTQGQQEGAILIEYNLAAPSNTPAGLWDVHARIGGFDGSNLQVAQCEKTPDTTITSSNLDQSCIAAYLTLHITSGSSALYLENVWLWTADHDVDNPDLTQITIYAGRGLLDESTNGPVWLIGTAVEHHTLYQYQYANAKNVYQGQIQTETAYYQPNPNAAIPFPTNAALNDPTFTGPSTISTNGTNIPALDGWGLRILNSQNIFTYGAGHYSFFDNYSTSCSNQGNGVKCQNHIVSVEGSSSGISIYNLNTVGTHFPISVSGTDVASWADNQDGFVQTIALFRS